MVTQEVASIQSPHAFPGTMMSWQWLRSSMAYSKELHRSEEDF